VFYLTNLILDYELEANLAAICNVGVIGANSGLVSFRICNLTAPNKDSRVVTLQTPLKFKAGSQFYLYISEDDVNTSVNLTGYELLLSKDSI